MMSEKKKLHIDEIVFTHFLNDGEQLVWKGQPNPKLMNDDHFNSFSEKSVKGWLAFYGLMTLIVFFQDSGQILWWCICSCALFPLVLTIYMSSPLHSKRDQLSYYSQDYTTFYAVTTHRVLLLRTHNEQELESLDITKLPQISLENDRIIFSFHKSFRWLDASLKPRAIGFFGLTHEEVQHVHQLILEQQAQLKAKNDE